MDYANPDALVSTEWLAKHLNTPDVRVVDASWQLPGSEQNALEEFENLHIPGAVYFDVDDIADTDVDLPHMLPSPEIFSSKARKLGLGDGLKIVVYDGSGGYLAAARVWWMFRVFGHDDVAVLNGGLPKWQEENRPLESGPARPKERHFTARMDNTLTRDLGQVTANLESRREQVVDARNRSRFTGAKPEPRPAKRQGHIPGSVNLPIGALMDPADGFTLRPADDIAAAFERAGVDRSKPVIATCGSGITAAVVALALYLLGHKDIPVYDGSWAEWGNRDDTPVET